MSRIYLVTSGEYSDYGIRAVFSTEELANQFVAQFNSSEDRYSLASIETWEIDEEVGKVKRIVYRCCSDGRQWTYPTMALPELRTPSPHINEGPREQFCADSYMSKEHARKLMFEESQRRLRSQNV